jgi:hypothetical protein
MKQNKKKKEEEKEERRKSWGTKGQYLAYRQDKVLPSCFTQAILLPAFA